MVSMASTKIQARDSHVQKDQRTEQLQPRIGRRSTAPKSVTDDKQSFVARALTSVAFLATIAAIVTGFYLKRGEYLVPGEGLGYKLGIAGGVTMLLVLFYPMAKRSTWLGFQKHSILWLRTHMFLGTVGPLLIFYHSNFSMGAINSNIALFSMIVVAISGVIGRFIYTRVHRGMSFTKHDLGSLLAVSSRLLADVGQDFGPSSASVAGLMSGFAQNAIPKSQKFLPNLYAAVTLPVRKTFARHKIMTELHVAVRSAAKSEGWTLLQKQTKFAAARQDVLEFLSCVSKASQLNFWERMFSLWHVLHVPCFFVLLVSGVLHVVAVHLY
jgi:hypothetical protein